MKFVENGRPDAGNYTGECYAECPNCEQDYFLNFVIENDVILYPEIKSFGWRKE